MNLSPFFKALIDADNTAIVICDTEHTIVYMNPAAAERYAKKGGAGLVGRSVMDCHNAASCGKITAVLDWFRKSSENNRIFTYHNTVENKDVYMIALRDENKNLIGYYEKHEFRTPETAELYGDIL